MMPPRVFTTSLLNPVLGGGTADTVENAPLIEHWRLKVATCGCLGKGLMDVGLVMVARHIKFLWRWTLCGADFDRRSGQAELCRKAPHNLKRAWSLYWHWSSLHLRPDKLSFRGCNFIGYRVYPDLMGATYSRANHALSGPQRILVPWTRSCGRDQKAIGI